MPHFVRSLPRLEKLSMENCEWVVSIEHPPRTLRVLSIKSSSSCLKDYKNSLRKIIFDPEMSPLNLLGASKRLSPSSFEVDGMIKIQPMASVEERVLRRLGWKHLEFTKERHLGTYTTRGSEGSQTQMYYEFGIFSTIYEGKGMPNWIRRRSKGSSISFTIPLSPKKEEDVLGYYKSWNHIIGGDLSGFQLTTGEYILDNMQYMRGDSRSYSRHPNYKEDIVRFKAFSQ
ncbi:hypothetical protein M8C21_021852 [Ambrosia artemisiifolia]|uniref:Uncharacterized protein n=1 Tax=Ambrosia artemisiifolia TaxID=4212 RepID=A0AAD5DAX4_AMBAR|nr:hypothetical protein M8C21_021852 [Ambrosia artemisiifolia]